MNQGATVSTQTHVPDQVSSNQLDWSAVLLQLAHRSAGLAWLTFALLFYLRSQAIHDITIALGLTCVISGYASLSFRRTDVREAVGVAIVGLLLLFTLPFLVSKGLLHLQ